MKRLILILMTLICSNFIKATEQMPDYLYFGNKKLILHTGWGHPSPLQTYYYQNNLDYPFQVLSTANYRGHVAIWEITDGKLYLKEIQIRKDSFAPTKYNVKSQKADFNQDNSVFADWFSGVISCRDKNSYYFHIRYGEVIDTQILSEKDYKKIRGISKKDTSNHELMNKYFMLLLNQNYISYYFRLNEDDEISMNDKQGRFNNRIGYSPLLEFYSNDHMQWAYNWENFEKNGAPHCKWIIMGDEIYLEDIQLYSGSGFYEIEKDSVNLEDIFNENIANNKVFADWLNGIYINKIWNRKRR